MDLIRWARAVPNLGNPVVIAALLTTLSVMGCSGGDSGGGDAPVQAPYVGNWYVAPADSYLEIKTDNTAVVRACSATGYNKILLTGTVQGDSLTLSSAAFNLPATTFSLLRNGDTLTVVDPDGLKTELTLAGAIPTVCPNDFIDITSVNPATGTAGVPTSFTVNFDYQLASKDNGIIHLGFAGSNVLTSNPLKVTRGAGSASLTASVLPVKSPSPGSFAAYVFLSEDPLPDPWTVLSSDFEAIEVVQ